MLARRRAWLVPLEALVLSGPAAIGLGACGGGSQVVVRAPPASSATTVPRTAAPTARAPAARAPVSGQQITVTPDRGLRSPQTVLVEASGFSPNESLVMNECAAKGQRTGPGDCNLSAMQVVTSDASGRVVVQFTVVRGPFGSDHVVCGPAQPCLVSVSQATYSPTQQASTRIHFAPG